jgi:hypothetical protein
MITIRSARQTLFKIDAKEADTLRRLLFDLEPQDQPLPTKYTKQYNDIIKKYMKEENVNEASGGLTASAEKSKFVNGYRALVKRGSATVLLTAKAWKKEEDAVKAAQDYIDDFHPINSNRTRDMKWAAYISTAAKNGKLAEDIIAEAKDFILSEGLKQLYAVVDEDGIVISTSSDEAGAKRSIVTAELPPLSVDDKTKLKIVKTKKPAEVGYPLEEAKMSRQQRTDAERVQYGVMKRDDYNKKYKLGKYKPAGNKLAGPGGLYKNLLAKGMSGVKENEDIEEAMNP